MATVAELIDKYKVSLAQLSAAKRAVAAAGLPAIEREEAKSRADLLAAMPADTPYPWTNDSDRVVKRRGWAGAYLDFVPASSVEASPAAPTSGMSLSRRLVYLVAFAGLAAYFSESVRGGLDYVASWIHPSDPAYSGTVSYNSGGKQIRALPARLGKVFVGTSEAVRRGDDFKAILEEHQAKVKSALALAADDPLTATLTAIIPDGTRNPTMEDRAKYADGLRDFGLGMQGLQPQDPGPVLPAPPSASIRVPPPPPSGAVAKKDAPAPGGLRLQDLGLKPPISSGQLAAEHLENAKAAFAGGKPDAADFEYTQALRYMPTYADAWVQRGSVRYTQKRYEDAAADYAEALKLRPDDVDIRSYLQLSREAAAKKEKAR